MQHIVMISNHHEMCFAHHCARCMRLCSSPLNIHHFSIYVHPHTNRTLYSEQRLSLDDSMIEV
jgi:hypothetical protein